MKENLLLLKDLFGPSRIKFINILYTSVSKTVYTDYLDNIINEYNNTYHSTIKMKSVDVKSSTYIDCNKENNKEDPKFKVGDHVKISKYKIIFEKGYLPNLLEEVFVLKKDRYTVL